MIEIVTRTADMDRERQQDELADHLGETITHGLCHSRFSHYAQAIGDLVMRSLAGHTRLSTPSR